MPDSVLTTESTVAESEEYNINLEPAIPWQGRPRGCNDIVWRYSANPIIKRNHIPAAACIYNSAVARYEDGFVGIFRVDYKNAMPFLHFGTSKDGIKWNIKEEKIDFIKTNDSPGIDEFAYDPRLCKIEDTWYITWCNGYHGPTIGVAYTKDFKSFHQLENAFLPFNRNGVMFPRKINGNYAMLSRPSDNGHTPFGDIFYSESPDMCFWGKHRHVMGTSELWWENKKIGAGPIPIETQEGWLLFYHGVMSTCNGFVYSMGAAILDLEKPSKLRYRCEPYVLHPEMDYEVTGRVSNIIFPCAALHDNTNGRLAIYYGAADTYTCIAFAQTEELINFIKANSTI